MNLDREVRKILNPPNNAHEGWHSPKDSGFCTSIVQGLKNIEGINVQDGFSRLWLKTSLIRWLHTLLETRGWFAEPPEKVGKYFQVRRIFLLACQERPVPKIKKSRMVSHHLDTPALHVSPDTVEAMINVLGPADKHKFMRHFLQHLRQTGQVLSLAEVSEAFGILPQSSLRRWKESVDVLMHHKDKFQDVYDLRAEVSNQYRKLA